MVAPSLVTVIFLDSGPGPVGRKILSIPLGPNVVFTKSATAIAPTKLYNLAISPLSSEASSFNTYGNTFPMISIN